MLSLVDTCITVILQYFAKNRFNRKPLSSLKPKEGLTFSTEGRLPGILMKYTVSNNSLLGLQRKN
jgi:hypothetical protein